jgi:hypothetical protein
MVICLVEIFVAKPEKRSRIEDLYRKGLNLIDENDDLKGVKSFKL